VTPSGPAYGDYWQLRGETPPEVKADLLGRSLAMTRPVPVASIGLSAPRCGYQGGHRSRVSPQSRRSCSAFGALSRIRAASVNVPSISSMW